jgi:hypothetical protein
MFEVRDVHHIVVVMYRNLDIKLTVEGYFVKDFC